MFFTRFYQIFYDFGSPLGSLWAPFGPPFLGELAVRFRIGAKVASRVLKESLLGAFRVPFGRIWGDISDDLGCILNTPFLGFLFVFITYFFDVHRVFFSYSLSFLELFSRYFLGIA